MVLTRLFALMGLFTIACGFILGFFLPDSFKNPRSTFLPKKSWFTERELHILQTRVLLDDPMKGKKKKSLGKAAFKQALTYWRLWIHVFISLCNNGPQRGFDTYAPSLVSGFGFADLASNALAAVGLFLQIPVSFSFSWFSDRYNRRGEAVIGGLTMTLIAYIMNRSFTELDGARGAKYFGVIWTQSESRFSADGVGEPG
jgi:hypothetical protein